MKGFISSILAVLTCAGLQAQSVVVPKLVVGVTIDQLRTDYLEAFSSLYGEDGFKRLWREGKTFQNVEYPYSNPDRSSAIASVNTGTVPFRHGIVSNKWMDVANLKVVSCVDDPAYMGNYTTQCSAPSNLLCSTLADELKVGTQQKAIVYAIAPERDAAVLSAGHAGNGAFWINPYTGKWCGTTYYGEFPWWVSQYNDAQSVDLRIDNLTWSPVYPRERYIFLPDWREDNFYHSFSDGKYRKYKSLISSPLVNDEVNALARVLFENGILGADEIPDFLSITYYAGNFEHKNVRECALEMQDTYVRLDRSIAELLNLVDRKIGLNNVLFYITSTGYSDAEAPDMGLYRIPTGDFYLNRCAALLNMYLMAQYGAGQYIDAYYNQQIYLNHKLIEEKGLDLVEIQNKSEEFLMQFSGVDDVYSAGRLLYRSWSPDLQKKRNAYHRKISGDLIIDVLPGWIAKDEDKPEKHQVIRYGIIPIPIYFIGFGLKPEKIESLVSVEQIAPTVASVLRIRSPNAAESKLLRLR